jgi:2-polyprenyl-3-methyl-5-hydroxy-6-metoxy-1,4-benzoquinol methylase
MGLGLYETLAHLGPLPAPEVARHSGVALRYAVEWLEQQAASGILLVDDAARPPLNRLYLLPPEHAEVLLQPESPFYVGPMSILPVVGMARMLPDLLEAYRSGRGIPYSSYGEEFRGGSAGLNRSIFVQDLPEWIAAAAPEADLRLRSGQARIADFGCGTGWSTLALAMAYPKAQMEGFDLDEPAIQEGRRRAAETGVTDRVAFHVQDITDPQMKGNYDLICIFDALHDMARPVEALETCLRLTSGAGPVLLMEPNAADAFAAPASETERFFYAVSLLHCLPVGLSETPSAATGTVMRPDTVRAYAAQAGFRRVEIVPIRNRFYRLYRLQ